MSKTIDERVVSMQFDNQRFEKNIEQTITSLNKLDDTINEFGSKGEDAFINLQEGLSRTDLMFAGFYEKIGGYLGDLAIKAGNFVKSMSFDQVIEGFHKYTAETNAAQTIVSNVGTSVEDTYKALDDIAYYTDKTSYHYEDLVQTAARFAQTGVDLDDAVEAVKGIGNWAALSGAGIEKADFAMSALSKSIGKGYVQLTEWNTISKVANMDSRQFMETVIETARETSQAFREWEAVNGQMDPSQFTTEMFGNNHLFTSDVLINTLKKYSDAEGELGQRAYDAASEAKTLSEAIGAVKDAVSSGFSLSFRYLFGNYDEARKFWTFVQDAMLDIFTIGIDFRNKVLEKWHVADVGGWADAFDALQSFWEGIRNLGEPIGEAFQNIFKFNVDESVEKLSDLVTKFKEAAENFELLTGAWKNKDSWQKALDDYISSGPLGKINVGAETLINLQNEGDIIKQSEKLHDNLKDAFEGIFSVVDLGKNVFSGFIDGLKNIASFIKPLTTLIVGIAGAIGRFVKNISNAVKKSGVFNKVFGTIGKVIGGTLTKAIEFLITLFDKLFGKVKKSDGFNTLKTILEKVGAVFEWLGDKILNKIVIPAFDILTSVLSGVVDFISPIVRKVKDLWDGFKKSTVVTDAAKALKDFWDSFKNSKFISDAIEIVKNFWDNVTNSKVIDNAIQFVKDLWDSFKNSKFVSDAIQVVKNFWDSFKNSKFVSDAIQAVKDFWDSVKESGVIKTITDYIKDLWNSFKNSEFVEGAITLLNNFKTDVLEPIAEWFKKAAEKVKEFWESFKNSKFVTDATKVIKDLWESFKESKLVQGAIDIIKDFRENGLKPLDRIKKIGSKVKEFWDNFKNSKFVTDAIQAVGDFWQSLKESKSISEAFEAIKDFIKKILEPLKEKFKEATDKIKEFWEKFKETSFVKKAGEILDDFKSTYLKPVKEWFEKAAKSVKDFWEEFKEDKLSAIKNLFNNTLGPIIEKIKDLRDRILGVFGGDDQLSANASEASGVFEGFLGVITKVRDYIMDKLNPALDWLKEKLDKVKSFFQPVLDFIGKIGDAIKNFFKSFSSKDVEDGVSIFETIGAALKTAFDWIVDKVKIVIDFLKDSGITFKDIVELVLAVLGGKLLWNTSNFVSKLGGVADSIAGFFDRFKKAEQTGKLIKNIGIALLLMAAGLFAIAQIPKDQVESAVMAMMGLAFVLGILAKVLDSTNLFDPKKTSISASLGSVFSTTIKAFEKFDTKWASIGIAIVGFAGGMAILINTLKDLTEFMQKYNVVNAGIALGIAMAAITASMKILGTGSKVNIADAATIVAFGFSIKLITGALESLSSFNGGGDYIAILANAGVIALIIKALGKAMSSIKKVGLGSAAAVIAFGISIKILVGSIKELYGISGDIGRLVVSAGSIMLLITVMSLAIDNASKGGLKAAAGIVAFTAAVHYVVEAIKELGVFYNEYCGDAILASAALVIIMAAMAYALDVASDTDSFAGAAGILAMGVALALLVEPLKALSQMNLGQWLLSVIGISAVMLALAFAVQVASSALTPLAIAIAAVVTAVAAFMAVMILFGSTLDSTGEAITERIDAFFAKLGEWAVKIGEMAFTFIANFILGLAKGAGELVTAVITIIYELAHALYENKEVIADAVYELLMTILQIILTVLNNILNGILEFFGMARVETGNIFTDLIGIVISGAARILMAVVDVLTDILTHIIEFIVLAPLYIAKFFAELFGLNTEKLDQIISDISGFFENVIEDIKEELAAIWEKVTGWFKDLWGKIKGIFKGKDAETGDLAEDAKEGMDRVTDAMDESIQEGGAEVEESARSLSFDTIDAMGQSGEAEKQAEEEAKSIMDGFSLPFDVKSDGATSLLNSVGDLSGGVLDGLGLGGTANSESYETGAQFTTGFTNGITSGQNGVWNAATSIGKQALQALQQAIDSHSPSKAAMKLGDFLGLGFAEGIDNGAEDAMHSAEEMGGNAVSILKEALSGFDTLSTDEIENPVIKPVLDLSEIQNGQASIADILSGRYSVGLAGSISSITGNRMPTGNQDNSTTTINMTVNGAAGQDVNDLAEIVTRRINQSLRSRERVWA